MPPVVGSFGLLGLLSIGTPIWVISGILLLLLLLLALIVSVRVRRWSATGKRVKHLWDLILRKVVG